MKPSRTVSTDASPFAVVSVKYWLHKDELNLWAPWYFANLSWKWVTRYEEHFKNEAKGHYYFMVSSYYAIFLRSRYTVLVGPLESEVDSFDLVMSWLTSIDLLLRNRLTIVSISVSHGLRLKMQLYEPHYLTASLTNFTVPHFIEYWES